MQQNDHRIIMASFKFKATVASELFPFKVEFWKIYKITFFEICHNYCSKVSLYDGDHDGVLIILYIFPESHSV